MEPALIYAVSDSFKHKVNWVTVTPDSEWIYFGAEGDVNETMALGEVAEYFSYFPVLIVINRKDSATVQADDLKQFLRGTSSYKKFSFWISHLNA